MSKVFLKIYHDSQYFCNAFPNNYAFHYFKIEGVCKTSPEFIELYFLICLLLSLLRV